MTTFYFKRVGFVFGNQWSIDADGFDFSVLGVSITHDKDTKETFAMFALLGLGFGFSWSRY